MQFNTKYISPNTPMKFTVDNVEYEMFPTDDSQNSSFATVILKDGITGDRHMCYGDMELNGHYFTFTHPMEYNYNRDNYIYGTDILVTVT